MCSRRPACPACCLLDCRVRHSPTQFRMASLLPCCTPSCCLSADNVPGVAGIGPKTAASLLKEYGSLESVMEHAADVKPKKAAAQLVSGEKGWEGGLGSLGGHLRDGGPLEHPSFPLSWEARPGLQTSSTGCRYLIA